MKTYSIAGLPGDGVGPEVYQQAKRVLDVVQERVGGYELDIQDYDVGVGRYQKNRLRYQR